MAVTDTAASARHILATTEPAPSIVPARKRTAAMEAIEDVTYGSVRHVG